MSEGKESSELSNRISLPFAHAKELIEFFKKANILYLATLSVSVLYKLCRPPAVKLYFHLIDKVKLY